MKKTRSKSKKPAKLAKTVVPKPARLHLHRNRDGSEPRLKRRYDAAFRPSAEYLASLPDILEAEDAALGAPVPLQQVGVANFRLPLKHRGPDGRPLVLETRVTGTVSLDASLKGINMSRIVRSFYALKAKVFSPELLEQVLVGYRRSVGSISARVKLAFAYPILQHALRSGLAGYQYYDVSYEGSLDPAGRFRKFIEFDFVYSSACPCSGELSEHAREERGVYAIPHSQRSKARIRVEVAHGARIRVEELQKLCLEALSTETQVMVKREDEQAFAELNGAHIKFVEDAARLLYQKLAGDRRITDFQACCAHFESLHSHDAVSAFCKGVPGGMSADTMEFPRG